MSAAAKSNLMPGKKKAAGAGQLRPVRADGAGFVGTIREPHAGAWQQNKELTAQTALAFSGVYACTSTIADDISKLPLKLRERDENGIAFWREDHWASRLFKKPNAHQTRLQFLQQYAICKLLTGNVYVIFARDDRFVPVAMYILDPRGVTPYISDAGEVYYQITNAAGNTNTVATVSQDQPLIPATDILHDRMMSVYHPLIGVSPLFAAAAAAQAGNSIIQNAKAFFANMARASGILTAPGKISRETAERLADKWRNNFTQGNIGQVAVLGDGMKWEPMTVNAADAQLIEILRWTIEDVARNYRVPLFMLGDLTKVSYRNSEQLARTYYQSTLQWHLESIETAFDKYFGFGPSHYMEFDLDELFRTEMDTRFQAYQTAIGAGIMSINEARARENLGPVEGGEEPRVQMQYVPLSQALEQPEEEEPAPEEGQDEGTPADDDAGQDEEQDSDEERDFQGYLARREIISKINGWSYVAHK
jgi:HK97 family phage portal protein